MLMDSIAAFLFITIIIIIHLIYFNSVRFNRKNTINGIVRNHLKRIKSHFNDPDLRYMDYDYELGYTDSIDTEVKKKLTQFLLNRGFKIKYNETKSGHSIIEIK